MSQLTDPNVIHSSEPDVCFAGRIVPDVADASEAGRQAAAGAPPRSPDAGPDQTHVGRLLAGLQESVHGAQPTATHADEVRFENRLAVVRLGIATSLFYAMRTKHAATAAHCLRVALSISAWAERMGLDNRSRDRIEVAALLHDIGKIGIPDRILRKPGKLSVDEQLSMDLTPPIGCEILRGCTDDTELLDIVLYSGTWYDSRRRQDGPRGAKLPLGSRMLAIADAFDSMTTDTVYRPALCRERASEELIAGAHTQFDPELVLDFCRMLEDRPEILQGCVVNRWLRQLQDNSSDSLWTGPSGASIAAISQDASRRESLFYQQLLSNTKDGIVFTDAEGTVIQWNHVMHTITSIAAEAMVGKKWTHEALRLREVDDHRDESLCLVEQCLTTHSCVSRSMLIEQPGADPTPVHLMVSPVAGSEPGIHGTVVIVRDMSEKAIMQEQLETLHEKSTQDPLTKVANRACFDERLEMTSELARKKRLNFSLIICDIDHFKRVNDVHGHPAGDDALRSFAAILQSHSRDGDLVARYGGEEFLLLAPNCDNATASKKAEAIRAALEKTPLASLKGDAVTASFGVTEFQPGDTAETVLARADRALLKAKDNGRNRVIQLGAGNKMETIGQDSESGSGWLGWLSASKSGSKDEFDILTPVPVDLAIEKLRGFIADHGAEIVSVKANQLSLNLQVTYSIGGRRRADHQMAVRVELTLSEQTDDRSQPRGPSKTNVHVHFRPIRTRDRRSREVEACSRQVISSLRSYLMGEVL